MKTLSYNHLLLVALFAMAFTACTGSGSTSSAPAGEKVGAKAAASSPDLNGAWATECAYLKDSNFTDDRYIYVKNVMYFEGSNFKYKGGSYSDSDCTYPIHTVFGSGSFKLTAGSQRYFNIWDVEYTYDREYSPKDGDYEPDLKREIQYREWSLYISYWNHPYMRVQNPNPRLWTPATEPYMPVYIKIKAGTFKMGSPSAEEGRTQYETQHIVTLTKDFEMGQTEVTQAQWASVMDSNPSPFKTGRHCPENFQTIRRVDVCANLPVTNVDSKQLDLFIARLNEAHDGYTYRLPTEAEWEYAARAGTESAYSFGVDSANIGDYAWYYDNSDKQPHEVKSKRPNPWGLYDMYGNASEWVQDYYHLYGTGPQVDPVDLNSGPLEPYARIKRGGSYRAGEAALRSANRDDQGFDGNNSGERMGIRLVRTIK